jgi:hypothetical protein
MYLISLYLDEEVSESNSEGVRIDLQLLDEVLKDLAMIIPKTGCHW